MEEKTEKKNKKKKIKAGGIDVTEVETSVMEDDETEKSFTTGLKKNTLGRLKSSRLLDSRSEKSKAEESKHDDNTEVSVSSKADKKQNRFSISLKNVKAHSRKSTRLSSDEETSQKFNHEDRSLIEEDNADEEVSELQKKSPKRKKTKKKEKESGIEKKTIGKNRFQKENYYTTSSCISS